MTKSIFITATDTECGKTYIATGILSLAKLRGLKTIGIKPVTSGCQLIDGKLYNDDALQLQRSASIHLPYDDINPFAFLPAVAPHILAEQSGITLDATSLLAHTQNALTSPADLHIIEGFGGWHAPLNSQETMADYAVKLDAQILLVVGMRLGCLNHAILSERAILQSGASCMGWIGNIINPNMECLTENLSTLEKCLRSPLLGIVQHRQSVVEALMPTMLF